MATKIEVKPDEKVEIVINGHSYTASAEEWHFAIKAHIRYMKALNEQIEGS